MMKKYLVTLMNGQSKEVLADKFDKEKDGTANFYRMNIETDQYELSAVFSCVMSVEQV